MTTTRPHITRVGRRRGGGALFCFAHGNARRLMSKQ